MQRLVRPLSIKNAIRNIHTPFGAPTEQQIKASQIKPLWENDDHTAIVLTLEDKGQAGLLNSALSVFQEYGINLTSV